jgi:hypothetical protein
MSFSDTLSSPLISASQHSATISVPSQLPPFCFLLAAITVTVGMCLGIFMGINQDFTLAPVHAHLNLLGWVSLFLFGIYYRTHAHAISRMAFDQSRRLLCVDGCWQSIAHSQHGVLRRDRMARPASIKVRCA